RQGNEVQFRESAKNRFPWKCPPPDQSPGPSTANNFFCSPEQALFRKFSFFGIEIDFFILYYFDFDTDFD
ncbi:MAG: hypothetical protein K9J79_07755, partial [Desulfobacteraceae bacterium]|nr:hypothetical protein [Desulfobacteraceae bacterium]